MKTNKQIEILEKAKTEALDVSAVFLALSKLSDPDTELDTIHAAGAEETAQFGFGALFRMLSKKVEHICEPLDAITSSLVDKDRRP